MPTGHKLPVLSAMDIAQLGANPEASVRAVARAMGAPVSTVRDTMRKWTPVVGEYRALQRDWLAGMWQVAAAGALDKLATMAYDGYSTASDAQKWAITAGIATDKLMVLHGMPTSIVANIHEVRHSLPQLATMLAGIAKRTSVTQVIDIPTVSSPCPSDSSRGGGKACIVPCQTGTGIGSPPSPVGAEAVPTPSLTQTKGGHIPGGEGMSGR